MIMCENKYLDILYLTIGQNKQYLEKKSLILAGK